MDKKNKIGFIGAGIMGQGMVQNLLKAGNEVSIIANKNRRPIEELVALGAKEMASLSDMVSYCNSFILCLPSSKIAISVCDELFLLLSPGALIIDCTTNELVTVIDLAKKAKTANLRYAEAPLTGGQQQSLEAKLGAIVGCDIGDFEIVSSILKPCCAQIERLGELGMGAKTKLISNFLALGTATLVVEAMKAANNLGVDWEKFYKLASQGSGHSMSLDRIAPKAIAGTHDGYVFTIANTVKDMEYISVLLKDQPDAAAITEVFLEIYKNAANNGMQDSFLSARLENK
ncbi:MAG: NAD(P)-dependent oxidoreductase [Gammaproteobacteria bacterium]|jgi:3-hydroxyisobutyrate dehydrogenase-like beta-hydroxyacid dehydrogenase|nr:NAD(P)-dependent oxidoreductase [Gammaproteobacteria bacterium]